MAEPVIKPEKITKPIQLLGAWLAGLFSIDVAFLLAASKLPAGSWEASTLVVAAVINVPIFLIAVFVLQTKFRPELQEDSYYATYLSQRTNEKIVITKDEQRFIRVQEQISDLEKRIVPQRSAGGALGGLVVGINQYFADKDDLGRKLLDFGIPSYTLFGGDEPPSERVVSISQHLDSETFAAVLSLVSDLGFARYNMFDNIAEEAEEDVLLGSYGRANRIIPKPAA